MSAVSPSFVAGGTIAVSTFVKIDVTADNQVVAATGVTDKPIAVATEASALAPIPGAATSAATVGVPVKVYGVGEICNLSIGAGGCTRGDFLASDATGNGVTAVAGNYYGAYALASATAGALTRVQVMFGKL